MQLKRVFTSLIHKLKDNLPFGCLKMKNRQQMSIGQGTSARLWWPHLSQKVAILPQYLKQKTVTDN